MRALHEIVAAALTLSVAEREQLIDQVLRSLNEPSPFEPDVAWGAEAVQHLRSIDTGVESAIPSDTVFAEARKLAR